MAKVLKFLFISLASVSLLACIAFGIGMNFPSFRQATYNFLNVIPKEEHNESVKDYDKLYASLVNAEEEKSESVAKLKVANTRVQTLTDQLETLNVRYTNLLSDKDADTQEINSLREEIQRLNNEKEQLNYLIQDYENRIRELENIINDLNSQLEQIVSFSPSISGINGSVILLDENNQIIFDSSSPTVELSYLFDMDFTTLHSGQISADFTIYGEYGNEQSNISGTMQFYPQKLTIHTFLWHPTEYTYMPFDNEHIQSLIDMGYTSVTYSVYAFAYNNGEFSFHMNFNTYHSEVN